MTPSFILICFIIGVQLLYTGAGMAVCVFEPPYVGSAECTDGRFMQSLAACLAVALAIHRGEK